MARKKLQSPKASKGDRAHSVVKASLSAIPVIGGPAAELFQNVVQPPLERRRIEWMNSVAEKLEDLEKQDRLDVTSLTNNEEFISAVMYATTLALRTHNESKLNALRNALVNIAIGQAPEETLQHIFMNLIDTLTELHVRILKTFQAPTPPPGMSAGGLSDVLEHNLPDMRGQKELYRQIWRELYNHGLFVADNLNMTMTGSGLAQKQTTRLGDGLLDLISAPE